MRVGKHQAWATTIVAPESVGSLTTKGQSEPTCRVSCSASQALPHLTSESLIRVAHPSRSSESLIRAHPSRSSGPSPAQLESESGRDSDAGGRPFPASLEPGLHARTSSFRGARPSRSSESLNRVTRPSRSSESLVRPSRPGTGALRTGPRGPPSQSTARLPTHTRPRAHTHTGKRAHARAPARGCGAGLGHGGARAGRDGGKGERNRVCVCVGGETGLGV